jgi:hypothetical protein
MKRISLIAAVLISSFIVSCEKDEVKVAVIGITVMPSTAVSS